MLLDSRASSNSKPLENPSEIHGASQDDALSVGLRITGGNTEQARRDALPGMKHGA